MTWIYNVSMHLLTNSKTKQSYRALYAGAVGYKNNSSKECVKKLGLLLRERYKIHATTSRRAHVGKYALQLEPENGNHMCGRGDFFIHGDDSLNPGHASEACIVAGSALRHIIWESGDRELEVI